MLSEILKNHHVVLGSQSPRRQDFFKALGIDFTVEINPIHETFPDTLQKEEIPAFLSILKAKAYPNLKPHQILITADTIVWHNHHALGKPKDEEEAFRVISELSGTVHEVFSSVCFTSPEKQVVVTDSTKVWFKKLTKEEITYYITHYQPFDKAGSYGIQEWIGMIGVTKIEGSFNAVMGLPTHLVYETLTKFVLP